MVAADGPELRALAAGQIQPPAHQPLEQRLLAVHQELGEVIARHRPGEMAVEEVFLAKNARSALALGHVRGVALLCAAEAGIPVFGYATRTIKKALVGYGQAGKEQVSHMVKIMLGLREDLGADAADALACAICHVNTQATLARLASGPGSRLPQGARLGRRR